MSSRTFDWLQPADRHTELIDPVISVRQLSFVDVRRRRLTRFDHCLVYATKDHDYEVFQPPHRPRATTRYTAVYEIDTGVHPVRAELRLPSKNDALEFQATVDFRWQVRDPVWFIRSGCRDVPRLLIDELEKQARTGTRAFPITDSALAEARVRAAAADWLPPGTDAGLTCTWTLRLRRNEEEIRHQLRLQQIHHTADEQVLTEYRGEQTDEARDSRRSALLRLQAENVKLYEAFLGQGTLRALAWYLSQHPDKVETVVQGMRQDQVQLVQKQLELVTKLFDTETAENHELAEPRQHAIQALNKVLAQPLPGSASEDSSGPATEEPLWKPPPGYGRRPSAPENG
ncbi:hypothetical protein [Streptomyces sp. NPDC012888]|uniref:hypothetical protein n=1 Tax=Streptomyces sp. NPDC012888 TaxID=3364855 RepID=UPI0036CAECAB